MCILKKDGTLLASYSTKPGAWKDGKNANKYQRRTFEYTGDGTGSVRIHLRPFTLHSGRFGGAVDDLTISKVASGRTVFVESFDKLQQRNAPGSQAHTRRPVYFGATSDRWKISGLNSIHAVEHSRGNFALQLFSGLGGSVMIEAQTADEKRLQAKIDAIDRQLKSMPSGIQQVHSVVSRNPGVMRVLVRGDVTRPSDEVAPGGIEAVKSVPSSFGVDNSASDAERRRALASWITHRDNGPFHRVAVNRVWHYHFGRGIVSSPSDIGFNGARPSHPPIVGLVGVLVPRKRLFAEEAP